MRRLFHGSNVLLDKRLALVADRSRDPKPLDDRRRVRDFLHRDLGVHPDVAKVPVVLLRELWEGRPFSTWTELVSFGLGAAGFQSVQALVDVAGEPTPTELAIVDDVDAHLHLL